MHGLDAFRVPAQLRERVQQGESIRDHPALADELRGLGVDQQGLDKLEALQAQVAVGAAAQRRRAGRPRRVSSCSTPVSTRRWRGRSSSSLQAEDATALSGLGGDVDDLVGEMESLRTALDEAGRASRGATATGTA